MKLNEQFLAKLKYMNNIMKMDNAVGDQWTYCNVSKKKARGFNEARKQGKFKINCVDGPQWALKMIGVRCTSWYGGKAEIVWLNDHAKKDVEKYFDIINTGGKTPANLYNDMELCDGDILLGYTNMTHTNVYYGGKKSFDSGHAYAIGSGEGAKIRKFIGGLTYKNNKVHFILRFKDKYRAHYRVQCGAFKTLEEYNKRVKLVESKGFSTTQVVEDDMYKVQIGLFKGKTNAKRLAAKAKEKKLDVFVKEIE